MAIKLIQITAYVRNEEDLMLWKALPNKTEAIHQMLHRKDSMDVTSSVYKPLFIPSDNLDRDNP